MILVEVTNLKKDNIKNAMGNAESAKINTNKEYVRRVACKVVKWTQAMINMNEDSMNITNNDTTLVVT